MNITRKPQVCVSTSDRFHVAELTGNLNIIRKKRYRILSNRTTGWLGNGRGGCNRK